MKTVPLSANSSTQDTHFIVDDEDYEKVTLYKWHVVGSRGGYVFIRRWARKEERVAGSPTKVSLHRFILGLHLSYAKLGEEVDHINRNTFDNRKENLRVVNRHQNQRNKNNNSKIGLGLWGATFNIALKSYKKWQANFHIKGRTFMVGYFDTETEAHEAAKTRYREIVGKEPQF